jgi:hypothetical protein
MTFEVTFVHVRRGASPIPEFENRHSTAARIWQIACSEAGMIRKLKTGEFRLYSRKKDTATSKRRNLATFGTREAAEKHERAVQYFKRQS